MGGRTQRAFIDDIARVSHRSISWRNVSTHDYMLASIRSFNDANGTAFEPLFKYMLQPPIDGLSHLDNRIYDVSPMHTEEALDHSPSRVIERIARKINDKT
ncbi:fido (protein-threonine AMPylation protein) [Arcanobacterium pluranimalium]|nr:fido (protein-threonine AMPylation protein) [Arcanobacterium pluranimalium]